MHASIAYMSIEIFYIIFNVYIVFFDNCCAFNRTGTRQED